MEILSLTYIHNAAFKCLAVHGNPLSHDPTWASQDRPTKILFYFHHRNKDKHIGTCLYVLVWCASGSELEHVDLQAGAALVQYRPSLRSPVIQISENRKRVGRMRSTALLSLGCCYVELGKQRLTSVVRRHQCRPSGRLASKRNMRKPTKKHLRFETPFGGSGAGFDVHLRLIGKRVVDFLLAIIKLFSVAVMLVELRANIDWKAPF